MKILFVLLLALLSIPVYGQMKSGLIIGVSDSWLNNGDAHTSSYGGQYGEKGGDWRHRLSFNIGYQFSFDLKRNFVLNTSLQYQLRGVHTAFNRTMEDVVDETENWNSLCLHGSLDYYIYKGIYVGAGLEPTYYFNTRLPDNLGSKQVFDIPVLGRVGYDFKFLKIVLAYKHGFAKVYRSSMYPKVTTRDLQLSVFVPFHF